MAKSLLSRKAEEDLREIWRTLAVDNEMAADGLLIRILEKIELAATQPLMGSPRPELSSTTRILIEGRYIVIYEPMPYATAFLSWPLSTASATWKTGCDNV